ncbi:hypothetical protein THRCLA_00734 [Thraustotheca clavata]|uniref:Uncharacterized protein n=1 Tax=Thraustotheca clavata TaxID=74557 RepID=A0A1W0AAQ1_9STRA|nr:hypothetical protein THRCLA_00734 [Thraustotheca clavata]
MSSPARIRRIKIKVPEEVEIQQVKENNVPQVPVRVYLETMEWKSEPIPQHRYSHRPHIRQGTAGGIHGNMLYLFGGFEDNGQRSNRLVQYNMDTHEWTSIECTGKVPPPRYGHACAINGNELWLFGGQGPEEGLNSKNLFDDLSILDLTSFEWRRAVVSCVGVNGHVNFVPLARRGHSLLLHDNMLYVYGGSGLDRMYSKDAYFGDLQRLDLSSFCWYEPTMTGTIPEPRSNHSAVMLPGTNYMIVFGGQTARKFVLPPTKKKSPVHNTTAKSVIMESIPPDTGLTTNQVFALDVSTFDWHIIAPLDGTAPSSRYGHIMQVHPTNSLCLFMFGGIAYQGYNDGAIHCLDLELKRWSTIDCIEPIPPRIRHVFNIHNYQMMIFGGCGENGLCIGDVYTVKIPNVPPPKCLELFSHPPKTQKEDEVSLHPTAPPSPRPHTIGGFMGIKSLQIGTESIQNTVRISPIKLSRPTTCEKDWCSIGL